MKLNDVVTNLTKFELIHSIILYGSRAVGTQREESDFDLCIIPDPGVSIGFKERIALENSIPQNIDLSLMGELPVNIRCDKKLHHKLPCAAPSVWGNPTEICVSSNAGV